MDDFIITDTVDIIDDYNGGGIPKNSSNAVHKGMKFYIFILIYCFIAVALIILYNVRTSPILAGATVNYIESSDNSEINVTTSTDGIDPYVNINTATEEELMALNGIGEELAARIISYREEFGHFKCIDDIKNVKGIGEKLFDKIKQFIYVDYIPGSDSNTATYSSSITVATTITAGGITSFPIDINTATKEELTLLKGIGGVLADRIIDYRENIAPFGDEADIMNVSGIGKATYKNIKRYIFVSNEYRTNPISTTTTTQTSSANHHEEENSTYTAMTTTTTPRIGSIEINTATYSQLMTIPHMTDEIARGILFHVENAFFFNTIEELLLIPGVGNDRYNKIHMYFYIDTKYAEEFSKQQDANDILDREQHGD
ncbi:MAG: ComEA family DNA-binding protein [Clostridiales bacterium]|nr:ComEA family DNA-binding protein [Clostridiales bacterium]